MRMLKKNIEKHIKQGLKHYSLHIVKMQTKRGFHFLRKHMLKHMVILAHWTEDGSGKF